MLSNKEQFLVKHNSSVNRASTLFLSQVEHSQLYPKHSHNAKAQDRKLKMGQHVYAKNFREWIPGDIISKTGPLTFIVELTDGRQLG